MRKSNKILSWLSGAMVAAALAAPSVSNATLAGPGDAAFVAFSSRSTVADQFAVVFLKDVATGQSVNFTTNNWSQKSTHGSSLQVNNGSWNSQEATYNWTATNNISGSGIAYLAGSVLEVFNTQPVSAKVFDPSGAEVTNASDKTALVWPVNNYFGLSNNGDNLYAYLGTFVPNRISGTPQPTPQAFLAALSFNGIGFNGISKPTQGYHNTGDGDLPAAFQTAGVGVVELPGAAGTPNVTVTGTPIGTGYYNQINGNVGSQAELLTQINNPSNWTELALTNQTGLADSQNTDLPYNQALAQPYGPYLDAEPAGFQVTASAVATSVVGDLTPVAEPALFVPTYSVSGGANPGDIAFVAFAAQGTVADQFAFLLTKGVTTGDTYIFTDDNWDNTVGQFVNNENVISWTADKPYAAGTVIQVLNTDPYQAVAFQGGASIGPAGQIASSAVVKPIGAGSSFGLDKNGDNLFAYVGALPNATGTPSYPTWVTGLTYIYEWNNVVASGTPNRSSSSSGEVPNVLLTPVGTAQAIPYSDYSFDIYEEDVTYADFTLATGTIVSGTSSALDADINTVGSSTVNSGTNIDLPTAGPTAATYQWTVTAYE